jgi:N-acetylmuramoyl-L-alanine amidase
VNKHKISMLLMAVCLMLSPVQALAAKIVVDAGHGGTDPGAVGINGLQEKTVNLDIAQKLKNQLASKGYDVVMTRSTDVFVPLADRVEFTDKQDADLFVSIHANSYTSSSARGSMVLYYDNANPNPQYPASEQMKALTKMSKSLAQKVLDSILDKVGTIDKGLLPSSAYVVRMGSIPSILVETAFLSNSKDADLLANPDNRTLFASAIEMGIEAYLPPKQKPSSPQDKLPDISGHWAEQAVLRLSKQGIIEGGTGNRFQPDRALTRAEWVALISRVFPDAFKQPACASASAAGSVSGTVYAPCAKPAAKTAVKDLPAAHWAHGLMLNAADSGLINGYEDGTIRPDQPITRSEVAALFQRLLGEPKWNGKTTFADVPATYWAAKPIYSLKEANLLDGMTASTFAPASSMTRAQAAALLDRYVQNRK